MILFTVRTLLIIESDQIVIQVYRVTNLCQNRVATVIIWILFNVAKLCPIFVMEIADNWKEPTPYLTNVSKI